MNKSTEQFSGQASSSLDWALVLDRPLQATDVEAFLSALMEALKQQGFSSVARRTNLNRSWLYRVVCTGGNPRLSTLYALLRALGLRLSVVCLPGPSSQSEADQSSLH